VSVKFCSSPRTLRRHLLHSPLCPLPVKREGTCFGVHGDVRAGLPHQEGQRHKTEELCSASFSKCLVYSLAGRLDSELGAWRSRPLEGEGYPYLFVDARYEKARTNGRVVSQGVLIASAVREDGAREILAVEVADTESEATYHELFRSLKRRGSKGVQLVVSDDHEGLKSVVSRHFQGAAHQRCQVHYQRNLAGSRTAAAERKAGTRACAPRSDDGIGDDRDLRG
jgi:transposase-like protein